MMMEISELMAQLSRAGEFLARPEGCAGQGGSWGHHPSHNVHSGLSQQQLTLNFVNLTIFLRPPPSTLRFPQSPIQRLLMSGR